MKANTLSLAKIEANPDICHGQPVFKDTRVMVWQVLELLESGTTQKEIYQAYPSLPSHAVEAALHFAAQRVKGLSYASHNTDLVSA